MPETTLLAAMFVLGILLGVLITKWIRDDREHECYMQGWHNGFHKGYEAQSGETVLIDPPPNGW
jgi:hypothetical protein